MSGSTEQSINNQAVVQVHQCTICQKNFRHIGLLNQHLKRSKTCGNERLQCALCNKEFASQQRLNSHLSTAVHRAAVAATTLQQYQAQTRNEEKLNASGVVSAQSASQASSTNVSSSLVIKHLTSSKIEEYDKVVASLKSEGILDQSLIYSLIQQAIKDNAPSQPTSVQTFNVQVVTNNVQHIKNVKTIVGDNNVDNSINYLNQVAKVTQESKERLFDSTALAKAIDEKISKEDHVLHGAMGNIKLFKDVCLQDPDTQMPYLYPCKSKKDGENQYGYIDVDGENKFIDGTSLHTTYKEGLTKSKEYEQIYEEIIQDLILSCDTTDTMLKHRFRTTSPEKWNSMLTSCIQKLFESRKRKPVLTDDTHTKCMKTSLTSTKSLEQTLEEQGYELDEEDVKYIQEKAKKEFIRQMECEDAQSIL
jgi:hypothetical protein